MRPTITICGRCADPLVPAAGSPARALLTHGPASYAMGVDMRNEAACLRPSRGGWAGPRRPRRRARRPASGAPKRPAGRGSPTARAVVAPERLGELGGLAVADAVGDLADGEAASPAARRRAPCARRSGARGRWCRRSRRRRAGAAGARRRHAARCRRARGPRRTLVDDGDGVLEEAGAEADGARSLLWHCGFYERCVREDAPSTRQLPKLAHWRSGVTMGSDAVVTGW